MFESIAIRPTIAVFPVLVGPLQTLLALLPAILLGVASMLFAALKPGGFVKLMRFCWRQKLFLGTVAAVVLVWRSGIPARLLGSFTSTVQHFPSRHADRDGAVTDWSSLRGGVHCQGRGPGDLDATAPGTIWTNSRDATVFSSPAISGEQVIYSTATEIGPFSPEGRGAIVCVDAHSGQQIWRYAPDNYRATISSPVVSGNSVVCGEGLHQVEDARITCLDLASGARRWEFRTKSHVESTAAIADGRVFIGAGSDGFYCLSIDPDSDGQPRVLWHLNAAEFADCESSPVVDDGVVYFGLGEGGCAVCAVQAESGALLWKIETPYPVFASPMVAEGKLYLATGNGNYVQSAADLLEMRLQILRDDGASEEQIAAAREKLKPVGEVWCVDLATRAIDWKFTTGDAILGAIARLDANDARASAARASLVFGSRDGSLYQVSLQGELLNRFQLHEPLISSPALGLKHIYCASATGRLFCLTQDSLSPVWETSLGSGTTFSSSPTVAHGHVYIGTAQSGFRCLGQPGEPERPIWTRGEYGGSADDVPLSDLVEILWTEPEQADQSYRATGPLMPLEGAIYSAGLRSRTPEICKWDFPKGELRPHQVWSQSFSEPVEVPLVGYGDRIGVIEGTTESRRLHLLSAMDGRPIWSLSLAGYPATDSQPGSIPAGMTLDGQRLFAWTSTDRLGCVDLASGRTVWDPWTKWERQNAGAPSPEIGFGSPAVANDLLFSITVARDGEKAEASPKAWLSAQDAPTGVLIWKVELNERPLGGPVVDGVNLRLRFRDHVALHQMIDGSMLQTRPPEETPLAAALAANGVQETVRSSVLLQGRGYVVTDQGRIICLGVAQP
jgi:outer membrane protein assembly factor BamB